MESTYLVPKQERALQKRHVSKPTDVAGLILEAWAQGFMVGALIIMSCITLVNMRRGVLLHKIILVELLFGIWHGFFIFYDPPVYGWYLSVSAIFLNISWSLHNVIAWMKNKPFLSRRVSLIYIISVAAVQPYWVIEIYANFTYFNNINTLFVHTRPYEALFRDPWWIFTTISLFYNIKSRYELTLTEILRLSPRFAVMLASMILSICFLITDICSVTGAFNSVGSLPLGINPFWKLSFVFKCLTDSVILDDFKTALDRLRAFKISRLGSFAIDGSANSREWRKGLSADHHPWDNNNNNQNGHEDPYKGVAGYHLSPPAAAGSDSRKKLGNDTTVFATTRRIRKDSLNPFSSTRKRGFNKKHTRTTSPPTANTNLTTFPRSSPAVSPFHDETPFSWPLQPNPVPPSSSETANDKPSTTHLENSPPAKSPRPNIFDIGATTTSTTRKVPGRETRDRDDKIENADNVLGFSATRSGYLGNPEPSWLETGAGARASRGGDGNGGSSTQDHETSRYDHSEDDVDDNNHHYARDEDGQRIRDEEHGIHPHPLAASPPQSPFSSR